MSSFPRFDPWAKATPETDGAAKAAKAAKPQPNTETTDASGWDAEDWRAFFEERARIAMDEGLDDATAGRRAHECCIAEWLIRNPPPASRPDTCAACGAHLHGHGLPLAVRVKGAKRGDWRGHVWVCDSTGRCAESYYHQRRAHAEAALSHGR